VKLRKVTSVLILKQPYLQWLNTCNQLKIKNFEAPKHYAMLLILPFPKVLSFVRNSSLNVRIASVIIHLLNSESSFFP
jgi:hypothetical protein